MHNEICSKRMRISEGNKQKDDEDCQDKCVSPFFFPLCSSRKWENEKREERRKLENYSSSLMQNRLISVFVVEK